VLLLASRITLSLGLPVRSFPAFAIGGELLVVTSPSGATVELPVLLPPSSAPPPSSSVRFSSSSTVAAVPAVVLVVFSEYAV
jgi:hypothetical protein